MGLVQSPKSMRIRSSDQHDPWHILVFLYVSAPPFDCRCVCTNAAQMQQRVQVELNLGSVHVRKSVLLYASIPCHSTIVDAAEIFNIRNQSLCLSLGHHCMHMSLKRVRSGSHAAFKKLFLDTAMLCFNDLHNWHSRPHINLQSLLKMML